MMGCWHHGYSGGGIFADAYFETEEELYEYLQKKPDLKINQKAFSMMSEEWQDKLRDRLGD